MSLIEIVRSDGRPDCIVLRRYETGAPSTARTEFRLLNHLADRGFPVPRALSSAASWLLLEYRDGDPLWRPGEDHALAMAGFLVGLHGMTPGDALPGVPRQVTPARPSSTLLDLPADHEWPPGAPGDRRLLHGDLWTGNVLWRDGGLEAVIDWEDAVIGDPLADLAIARSNLVWTHGPAACRAFTSHYRNALGLDSRRLWLWDMHAAVIMAPHASAYAADWQDLGRSDISEAMILERLQDLVNGTFMP